MGVVGMLSLREREGMAQLMEEGAAKTTCILEINMATLGLIRVHGLAKAYYIAAGGTVEAITADPHCWYNLNDAALFWFVRKLSGANEIFKIMRDVPVALKQPCFECIYRALYAHPWRQELARVREFPGSVFDVVVQRLTRMGIDVNGERARPPVVFAAPLAARGPADNSLSDEDYSSEEIEPEEPS